MATQKIKFTKGMRDVELAIKEYDKRKKETKEERDARIRREIIEVKAEYKNNDIDEVDAVV